jgi:hypothetical protein
MHSVASRHSGSAAQGRHSRGVGAATPRPLNKRPTERLRLRPIGQRHRFFGLRRQLQKMPPTWASNSTLLTRRRALGGGTATASAINFSACGSCALQKPPAARGFKNQPFNAPARFGRFSQAYPPRIFWSCGNFFGAAVLRVDFERSRRTVDLASRAGLTPSPTCRSRQGGTRMGMWPFLATKGTPRRVGPPRAQRWRDFL